MLLRDCRFFADACRHALPMPPPLPLILLRCWLSRHCCHDYAIVTLLLPLIIFAFFSDFLYFFAADAFAVDFR